MKSKISSIIWTVLCCGLAINMIIAFWGHSSNHLDIILKYLSLSMTFSKTLMIAIICVGIITDIPWKRLLGLFFAYLVWLIFVAFTFLSYCA